MTTIQGRALAVAAALVVASLSGCTAGPAAPTKPAATTRYALPDDPVQARIRAAEQQAQADAPAPAPSAAPSAAPAVATAPESESGQPAVGIVAIRPRDPVQPGAETVDALGTVDDLIGLRLAARPKPADLASAEEVGPAQAAAAPSANSVKPTVPEPSVGPDESPDLLALPPPPPSRAQAGGVSQPTVSAKAPERLVLPEMDGAVPLPPARPFDPLAAYRSTPRVRPPLGQPGDAGSPLPVKGGSPDAAPGGADAAAYEMSRAPLSGAAIQVAGRTFTADEILRPIWAELDRLAWQLSAAAYPRRARELISDQLRVQTTEHLVLKEAERGMNESAREAMDRTMGDLLRERINRLFGGSEQKYRQQLKQQGLTFEQDKDRRRRQWVVKAFLREKFLPQVHITRPQAYEYYQQHMDRFSEEPRVRVRLIQIRPDRWYLTGDILTGPQRLEAIDKARQFAAGLLARIRARTITFDNATASSDGPADLGLIRKGSLRSQKLEETIFALGPGQISDVVEDENIFYIAQVTQADPPKVISFSEAQPVIIPRMEQERLDELSNEYMLKLYRDAGINEQAVAEFLDACVKVLPPPRRP